MFDMETKTGKLANALVTKGEAVTAAQAKKRFGIENIRSAVSRIRQTGFTINATQRKAKNGTQVTEYVLVGKTSVKPVKTVKTVAVKASVKKVAVKASAKK